MILVISPHISAALPKPDTDEVFCPVVSVEIGPFPQDVPAVLVYAAVETNPAHEEDVTEDDR